MELWIVKIDGVHDFKTSVKIAVNIVHWHLVKIAYLLEILVDSWTVVIKIHVYNFRLALKGGIFEIYIEILKIVVQLLFLFIILSHIATVRVRCARTVSALIIYFFFFQLFLLDISQSFLIFLIFIAQRHITVILNFFMVNHFVL